MNINTEKLPPLPKITHLTARSSSGTDMVSSENREDQPLLLKESTPPLTSDDLKALLKDVSNVSPSVFSTQHGDNDKTAYIQPKSSKSSEYSTFDETSLSWHGKHKPTDLVSPTISISKMESSPQQHSKHGSNEESWSSTSPMDGLKSNEVAELDEIETETFELRPLRTIQGNNRYMGSIFRSQSSNECGQSSQDRQLRYFALRQEQDGQESPQGAENRRKTALSRSQSHPLTTDEAEYSHYWRGQVTVINTPEAALPDVQLKSETALDKTMMSSAITKAIMQGNNTLVLECLRQGESPSVTCTKTGRSYLHVLASTATQDHELQWIPIIYQLSNAGIDVNAKDVDGRTAVRIAVMRRLVQILAALLKCGAEVDAGDEYYIEQVRGVAKSEMLEVIRRLTPSYWSAVHDLNHFKVKRLVQAWSRVNVSRNGQTLIEYAKQNAKDELVVKLLLQNEASIELAHAVMAGDAERAKVLLCDNAADVTTCDTSVRSNYFEPFAPLTLFGAAIKFGHSEILNVLRDTPKSKELGGKIDLYVDASAVKGEDTTGYARSGRALSSSSSSNSLVGHAFHYGSANGSGYDVRGSESTTSMLCTVL